MHINLAKHIITTASVSMLSIEFQPKGGFRVRDQSSRDILKKGFFGQSSGGTMGLSNEEALYLMDVRNAECAQGSKKLTFNEAASKFWSDKKFIARYFTYKDWRDRGLIIKGPNSATGQSGAGRIKQYPKSRFRINVKGAKGTFFKDDLITVLDDPVKGRKLYESYWIGQYGSYKAADRGKLNKIDIFETLFLIEKGIVSADNISKSGIFSAAERSRPDFQKLYSVYKDWREKGYVIKTGFKFGTHFRIYFPGAKPMSNGSGWTHSKHVIHVFPKDAKMLTSEWARAIRVAHSVRKTFILAIPGTARSSRVSIDYVLYHRRNGEAESPSNSKPRYAMLSLSEDEHIGGSEFSGAIKESMSKKLELIVAIADRETAVTYYKVRQIRLQGSKNDYYEIDWMQP